MKKFVIGVISIIFFCASVCSAAYLIHLKDGREIATHEYWEEGDQIKLHLYGGVVGISKEEVLSIEETDEQKKTIVKSESDVKEKDTHKKAEDVLQSDGNGKASDKSVDAKTENKSEKAAKEQPPKEKNSILKEFDALKKRFQKVEGMTKEEIFQFDKSLSELRNKILKAGLGGPYADQLVSLSEMGSKAEELYKKKSQ